MSSWNDYFWEPGGGVLRNRLGITDRALLRAAEYSAVALRLAELAEGPANVPHTFDADHICAIHRYLFQDLYEWAGEYRTVDMGRRDSPDFAPLETIDGELQHAALTIASTSRGR
jgi:cell filamentation protein